MQLIKLLIGLLGPDQKYGQTETRTDANKKFIVNGNPNHWLNNQIIGSDINFCLIWFDFKKPWIWIILFWYTSWP